MRSLAQRQLERLRQMAAAALEAPVLDRPDFGMAPEDLVVACDRALGWDSMDEESDEEKLALRATSHARCRDAWNLVRKAARGA